VGSRRLPDVRLPVLRLVAIVSFLDEERVLPALLDSIAAQTRPPDRLLLVDDGSRDGSAALAETFARRHDFASVLRRPVRPAETDRLATAAELRAFNWAVGTLDEPWELVAKLDADLSLPPKTLASVEARFRDDP
jgi:glycosyltransferase involved in cell wall biosynthesis